MNAIAKREYLVLLAILLLCGVGLLPALVTARQERRDGLRRDELALYKIKLEQLNNRLGSYPLQFDAGPYRYVVEESDGNHALGWYFRTELEREAEAEADFDYEPGRNYYYRVVREEDTTYYDICGGTSTCGSKPKDE